MHFHIKYNMAERPNLPRTASLSYRKYTQSCPQLYDSIGRTLEVLCIPRLPGQLLTISGSHIPLIAIYTSTIPQNDIADLGLHLTE